MDSYKAGGFEDPKGLIQASVEMANVLRNAAHCHRDTIRQDRSEIWIDNVILQAYLMALSKHVLEVILATYEPTKVPSAEEIDEMNLDIQTQIGKAIQGLLTENMGCDATILGQQITHEKDGDSS